MFVLRVGNVCISVSEDVCAGDNKFLVTYNRNSSVCVDRLGHGTYDVLTRICVILCQRVGV